MKRFSNVVFLAGLAAVGSSTTTTTTTGRRAKRDQVRAALTTLRRRPEVSSEYRLSVVVPAFREERIGMTVARLRSELEHVDRAGGLEIIVVDDGSGDDTPDRAEQAGADQVLRQPVNRGKGAAVRAGMLAARGRVVAFTDADLAYSPNQLLNLLEQVEIGWDVVVGSREHEDATTVAKASLVREVGHRVINFTTRSVLVGRHDDTQCGIKAFRGDVARLIFTHTRVDGFAFDVEVFHLVERYGLSLTDVAVQVENSARSTVNVGRDALRLVADLRRIRRWAREGVYDLVLPDTSVTSIVPTPAPAVDTTAAPTLALG